MELRNYSLGTSGMTYDFAVDGGGIGVIDSGIPIAPGFVLFLGQLKPTTQFAAGGVVEIRITAESPTAGSLPLTTFRVLPLGVDQLLSLVPVAAVPNTTGDATLGLEISNFAIIAGAGLFGFTNFILTE